MAHRDSKIQYSADNFRKPSVDPILIVDDEIDNLDALRRLLRTQYDVVTASSPVDGLRQAVTRQFHIVISDQRMPEMTGVEFLQKVRSVQPNAMRVLLTGYTDLESVIGAINQSQIYRYIAKPWDPEDLRMTLRQANEAYGLRREIEVKNEELSQTNQKLEGLLGELRGLDLAKARFLSLVSHELNTPLTVLTSYLPILKEAKLAGDPSRARDRITLATERLSTVIADVMDFIRIEASPSLTRTPNRLGDLIGESSKGIESGKKQVAVEGALEPVVLWDRTRMVMALRKALMELAIQSPKDAPIEIECHDLRDKISIELKRQGDPLPAHAFEKFDFGSDPLKHQKGLGLGLALLKTVVEAHGGTLSVGQSQKFAVVINVEIPTAFT